ncbi:MAG: hypothetical protein ACK52V_14120 [Betaproteobacteria bacterium]
MRLSLVPLTDAAIEHVIANLSAADRAELAASNVRYPLEIFLRARREAVVCGAVERDGLPIAVWGACRHPADDNVGLVWMVGTDGVKGTGRRGARVSRAALARIRPHFADLINWVHVEHVRAVTWLQWLGFAVDSQPVGPAGAFRNFWMRGGKHV